MVEWQKIVTKMIGDDVSGSFVSNLGKATFSDDFTSYLTQPSADAFWSPQGGTEILVNISTDVIDWNFVRGGSQRGVNFDLFRQGKFSTALSLSGNWTMRWQMNFGALVAPTTTTNRGFVGIFDLGFSNSDDGSQSFIAYRFEFDSGGSRVIELVTGNGSTIDTPTTINAFTTVFPISTTLYFELKRTADGNIEGTIYSDADFKIIVEKIKVTGVATAIDDLRFIRVINQDNLISDGTFDGTIQGVELFNESEGVQDFFTAKGDDKATSFDVIPALITPFIELAFI